MRGTLLNTATVAGGAALGLAVGRFIPPTYQPVVMSGMGLVSCLLGAKMFLQSKNILIVAAALAVGAVVGLALGIQEGLNAFAEWAKGALGGGGHFTEAIITPTLVFCVGPMTLLGCIEDGAEGKIELLSIKSTMDGIGAFFFAASLGSGVLVAAVVLLVFQGAITLLAKPLQRFAKDEEAVAEITAVGGAMMLAIGLSLLEIKKLPTASYLPALVFAPLFALLARRLNKKASA